MASGDARLFLLSRLQTTRTCVCGSATLVNRAGCSDENNAGGKSHSLGRDRGVGGGGRVGGGGCVVTVFGSDARPRRVGLRDDGRPFTLH